MPPSKMKEWSHIRSIWREKEMSRVVVATNSFGARRQSAAMLLWVLDMLFSFNSLAKIFFFLKK
jgi:hypothetical protein